MATVSNDSPKRENQNHQIPSFKAAVAERADIQPVLMTAVSPSSLRFQ